MKSIILASKSKVRKKILDENKIECIVEPSNLDEDEVKKSLINQGATPELISKNLAELKASKVSQKKLGEIVLGADSVIDLEGKLHIRTADDYNISYRCVLPKHKNEIFLTNFNFLTSSTAMVR